MLQLNVFYIEITNEKHPKILFIEYSTDFYSIARLNFNVT